MREFGIGRPLPRSEDLRLLRGKGRYTDDAVYAGQCHMLVVRSPFANALIKRINTRAASEASGVIAVLTGTDAEADGIGTLHTVVQRHKVDGSPMERPPYRVLALDQVRFVGDAVAVVIAETLNQARDAAELLEIDYQPLPAVTDIVEAVASGAAQVWPEQVTDNVGFVFALGDKTAVDEIFAVAPLISRVDFRISRVSANPLEARNAIAMFDPSDERYTLYAGVQNPHQLRAELASRTLGIPATRLRIVSSDVGGAFGMKGGTNPELVLVLWAARRTARTVRWQADRSESFLSDYHARDNVSQAELALSKDGEFLALRVHTIANLGAYLSFLTPHSSTNNLGGLAGTYRTPAIYTKVRGVYTHTQPTAPYRGAGRPEASFAIERVIDCAAAEHGFDAVQLRQRNLISKNEMPFKTGLVFTYDSGDFAANLQRAMVLADRDGFAARRAQSKAAGRLRGFGVANAIEIAGGPQGSPNEEACELRFDSNGGLTVLLGTHNHGQGHETVFRQIVVETLGVDPGKIAVLYGDTDMVLHGKGTFGSRSVTAGGAALLRAGAKIIARGRLIAAHLLEADSADIEFVDGHFRVAGTDKLLHIEDIAKNSFTLGKLPTELDMGLVESAIVSMKDATFPNGCHACEVEVDVETGVVKVLNYVVVDDVGTVINPLLLKGQIHGGVAQGLGQVLGEAIVYEASSGQLLSGSFMDYMMPRADDMPNILVESNPMPSNSNPLGAKGAGEAGTVGALPAIVNAVVNALQALGVTHLDMPLTPQKVWRAIGRASKAQ
ncbi:MAG: carbon-monoxide dehydrogenase large subunit [Gammaproteobacteria bacterium]|jgi:carbon-monoxide dehydrogenase large subunit